MTDASTLELRARVRTEDGVSEESAVRRPRVVLVQTQAEGAGRAGNLAHPGQRSQGQGIRRPLRLLLPSHRGVRPAAQHLLLQHATPEQRCEPDPDVHRPGSPPERIAGRCGSVLPALWQHRRHGGGLVCQGARGDHQPHLGEVAGAMVGAVHRRDARHARPVPRRRGQFQGDRGRVSRLSALVSRARAPDRPWLRDEADASEPGRRPRRAAASTRRHVAREASRGCIRARTWRPPSGCC